MSLWLYTNILLFVIVIFNLSYPLTQLPIHIVLGLSGLFLILFNWSRHAVFSTIRNATDRKKKIRLANISKRVYPFHRWVGSTALVLIIFHAGIIFHRYGFHSANLKLWSGILAGIVLLLMVLSGWLRLYFPSVKKRRVHIYLGLLLFFMVAIHTIIF